MVMAEDAAISEARLSSERHKSLASARKRATSWTTPTPQITPSREEARSVRFLVFQGLLAFVFLSNVTTWEGLSE
jgi:hypothetical protein